MHDEDKSRIAHTPPPFKQVRFGDFPIICASRGELVELALRDCAENAGSKLIFDANGHALSFARSNKHFSDLISHAEIIHADGGFLVTLSKYITANKIPERSATTDMLHDFAESFRSTEHGFFLLGSEESVNSKCAEILVKDYAGLKIRGRRNGFFSREEEHDVVRQINESGAEVLWVGLGKPLEQEFCVRWKSKLKPKWIITCGGCFNYVTGDYPRAPMWMQASNLEWVHRLSTRPGQLLKRYLTTTPHALWIALTDNSGHEDVDHPNLKR